MFSTSALIWRQAKTPTVVDVGMNQFIVLSRTETACITESTAEGRSPRGVEAQPIEESGSNRHHTLAHFQSVPRVLSHGGLVNCFAARVPLEEENICDGFRAIIIIAAYNHVLAWNADRRHIDTRRVPL